MNDVTKSALDAKCDEAEAVGRGDAAEAIGIAQRSDEAVNFITGNSMFPALRGFANAERYYNLGNVWDGLNLTDESLVWEAYVAGFEEALDEAEVYLGSNEDEGSLYVTDLKRWRWAENENAETLTEEWEERPAE